MTTEEMITDWINRIDEAKSALDNFRAYLAIWSHYDTQVNDDEFMAVLQNVILAGLLEFFDGMDSPTLDELREALTGVEA